MLTELSENLYRLLLGFTSCKVNPDVPAIHSIAADGEDAVGIVAPATPTDRGYLLAVEHETGV